MSLQDDAFELDDALKGWKKEAFNRIWEIFCELEAENEDLLRYKRVITGFKELLNE